jgi:hypothetical protein
MNEAAIKDPTIRKVRNRGFTPVRYRTELGVHHGWIARRGTKWIYFYSVTEDRELQLDPSEERHMTEVTMRARGSLR